MFARNNVMVFIEHHENKIAEISLELLSKARELADILGVELEALAIGHDMQGKLTKLGRYGCKRVYYIDDPRLKYFTSVPYAKTIVQVLQKYAPQIMLFGATTTGRDVAPRVASALRCGLTADCTDLKIGEYKSKGKLYKDVLLQIRPAFGGNVLATIVSPESCPSMATVREGVMRRITWDQSSDVEIIRESVQLKEEEFPTEILVRHHQEKRVDLKSAKIIVAAGMGASDSKSLELIEQLASMLGGVVASTRPMVDSGFFSKDRQVGQTGITVRPNLYIACGISGQVQHRAGMAESKRIIAINSDPDAPIFDFAHYSIVGDVNDVLSKMINAYKERV